MAIALLKKLLCSNFKLKNKVGNLPTLFFLSIICITHLNLKAQPNLVPNYSFETYIQCPSPSYKNPPPPWYLPTNVVECYMNSCANGLGLFGVPNNFSGSGNNYQYAKTGNAYTILGFYFTQNTNYNRSYLQIKLTDSLIAGKCYYTGYFLNLVNGLQLACNNAGLLFTKNAVYVDTIASHLGVLTANPQITNYGNPIIKDTQNWVKMSSIYIAQGGEKYITLGNFKTNAQTKFDTLQLPITYKGVVYNIDDVFVIPLDSMPLKADAGRDTTITTGDSAFIGSLTNGIANIAWYNAAGQKIDSVAPGFYVHPTATTFYVVEQTVCGYYSRDTVNVGVGTVPLKFISYNVISRNEKSVENIWKTANEINVNYFNVQRSINGKDFETIGKINAKGFSYNEYTFYDSPPVEGLGVVYYRIVSVDRDGKTSFSEVRNIEYRTRNNEVRIYPNPSKDFVNINCVGMREINIVNQLGQTVIHQMINTNSCVLNVQSLSKGIYILHIINKNNEVKNEKLFID